MILKEVKITIKKERSFYDYYNFKQTYQNQLLTLFFGEQMIRI